MLVISRKMGDSLKINDNILVKVLRIDSNTTKIGVSAPKDIKIDWLNGEETIAFENNLRQDANARAN